MSVEPIAVQPVTIIRSHDSLNGHSLLYTPSTSQQHIQIHSSRSFTPSANLLGQPFLTNTYSSHNQFSSGAVVSSPFNMQWAHPSQFQSVAHHFSPGIPAAASQGMQSPRSLSLAAPISNSSTAEAQAAFAHYFPRAADEVDFTTGQANQQENAVANRPPIPPESAFISRGTELKEVDSADERSQLSEAAKPTENSVPAQHPAALNTAKLAPGKSALLKGGVSVPPATIIERASESHRSGESPVSSQNPRVVELLLQPVAAPQDTSGPKPSQRILESIVAGRRSRSGSRKRKDASRSRELKHRGQSPDLLQIDTKNPSPA